MSDLISRQAAIDALCHVDEYNGRSIEAIRQLPSAQPEQRWIPCSERMPEEHEWIGTKKFGTTISDKVYVTFENPEEERFVTHLSFQNGKLSSFDQSKIDAFHKGSVPIAWMPLPEPYKAIDAMRSLPSAQPTIDAEPVRRGKWVKDDIDKYKCSLCGKGNNYAYSWSISKGDELQDLYCPNCGAKMEA